MKGRFRGPDASHRHRNCPRKADAINPGACRGPWSERLAATGALEDAQAQRTARPVFVCAKRRPNCYIFATKHGNFGLPCQLTSISVPAVSTMDELITPGPEEENFLKVAVAAIPRIAEIIAGLPIEHRAGALEVAERRYVQAARDFGCAEVEVRNWVSAVMRNLETQVHQRAGDQDKLNALLRGLM